MSRITLISRDGCHMCEVAEQTLERGFARFDLALAVVDEADGRLELQVEYSTELFDAVRIERLVDHLTAALAGGLASPRTAIDDLDLLPGDERDRVLRAWNPPATPYEPGLL